MSDVTAQDFIDAAGKFSDPKIVALFLAAAEQREQWDALNVVLNETESSYRYVRDQLDLAHRDIHAYRGALGYDVPGDCSDRLHDGTIPQNGLSNAKDQQIATLTAERDNLRRAYETVQDNEFAAMSPSTHAQNLAQQVRTLTAERDDARALARQATNGWACYATREVEHDDIARIHRVLDAMTKTPA